jgi:hypothetical protein
MGPDQNIWGKTNAGNTDQNGHWQNLQRRLFRDKPKWGGIVRIQMESLMPDLSIKITNTKRFKEGVLMHI